MTTDPVLRLTSLSKYQRQALDLAARGRSDRQIAQQLSITVSYVTQLLASCRKKLGVDGDGHRGLVHWYWTSGPGYSEIRMAAVSDALREMTQMSNAIAATYRKVLDVQEQARK